MPTEAEEAPNLQDGEEVPILGNDEIVERADFLVFVILRAFADKLGDLVALPYRHHVDSNELNGLCVGTGRDGGAESCSGQYTDSSLTTTQGKQVTFDRGRGWTSFG
jgi:hypothetical protein